jgi:hypothetical protein
MMSRCLGVGIVLIACGIGTAGEPSRHEELVKAMLASLDQIGKTLKAIDVEDAAKAAKPELRKAADAYVEARNQAQKLPPPEKDEKERLARLYRLKIDESVKKMLVEVQRVSIIPGGRDALKEIEGVLKKDGK